MSVLDIFLHNSLQGMLLVATAELANTPFNQSVVLLCEHNPNGAMGLLLSCSSDDITIERLLEEMDINSEHFSPSSSVVWVGGPVDLERGMVLHDSDYEDETTIQINDNVFLSLSHAALEAIASGRLESGHYKVFLGYTAWGKEQLEHEIMEDCWVVAPVLPDVLFSPSPDFICQHTLATKVTSFLHGSQE